MGTETTETKRQGRAGKMSCMKVYKANLGSQLSFFDTGSFTRAHPHSNDPLERTDMNALKQPTRMKRQGRAKKTSCMNVHKANLGSQLSIFDTGSFTQPRPRSNDPPERVDMDALKRAGRMNLHGQPHDTNDATKESWANELHEHAQSQPRVTT